MPFAKQPPLLPGMMALRLIFGAMFLAFRIPGSCRPSGVNATPAFQGADEIGDKCWIFMHLQKSGGSTVKRILKDIWASKFTIYDSGQWKEGDVYLQRFGGNLTSGDQWHVVAGGYTDALRRSSVVENKCKWFTMFRHPISRMVSAYFYCKRAPKDKACASEVVNPNEVDLVAFAKHWGNFATRQFVLSLVDADAVMEYSRTDAARETLPSSVRRVSKLPGWYLLKMYLHADKAAASKYGGIPEAEMYDMLQPVQDLLRDTYDAIGILEDFENTLSLFDAALAMPGVDWHKQFTSEGPQKKNDRDKEEKEVALAEAWTSSEIKKYMQLDILLYEHAVDVFRQQTQDYLI